MRRTRTTAWAGRGSRRSRSQRGRRGRSASPGEALARLLPALVAIPILFLLVRYRAPVTRAVVAFVNALENAEASTPSLAPAPIVAPQRPSASLAEVPPAFPSAAVPPTEIDAAGTPTGAVTPDATERDDPADIAHVGDASAVAEEEVAAADTAQDEDSVPGDGSLDCPAEFPVKGNASSKIYHLPSSSYYAVTRATVCFRSPEAAERAGFRASRSSPIRSASSTAETSG